MRLRTVPVRIAAAFVAVTLSSAAAHAGAWLPAPGEYYSEIVGTRSVSDTYYDFERARYNRPFGGFEETHDIRLYNELGWRKWGSIILAVPIRTRTQSVGAEQGYGHLTETGLADIDLGLRVRLHDGATAIAAQFDWNAPLGYEHDPVDTSAVSVGLKHVQAASLGTGRQTVQGSLQLGRAFPSWSTFFEAECGYRTEIQQDGGSEIFGSAGAGVWLGPSVLVSGRISSVRSKDYFGTVGGSVVSAVIADRDLQTVNPQLLYRVDDRLDVFVGSIHTSNGLNAPHFDTVYVGMAFKQTRLNRLQGFLGGKRRP